MAQKQKRKIFISDPFTLHFAQDVLKAKSMESDGDKKYGATMVLPPEHPFWAKLEKQLNAGMVAKFGKVLAKPKHWPIRDGDEVEYVDDGMLFCTFKRYEDDGAPQILDRDKVEIIDRSDIYSGILCRVSYHVGGWGGRGNKFGSGVSLYLDNLQKLKDGKPIGRTRSKAVDDFSEWVDDEEEEGGSALD